MANLTTIVQRGNVLPTLAAANAGGDVAVLDRRVKLMVANGGGGAITVTVTPVGPFIMGAPARVTTVGIGGTERIPTWDQGNGAGRPDCGFANITYSGVTTVTVGAIFVEGG